MNQEAHLRMLVELRLPVKDIMLQLGVSRPTVYRLLDSYNLREKLQYRCSKYIVTKS